MLESANAGRGAASPGSDARPDAWQRSMALILDSYGSAGGDDEPSKQPSRGSQG